MPKGKVQVKQLGAKKAKEISRVFQELFQPNSGNVHIYATKISDLSKHMKKIAVLLRSMDQSLTNERIYSNGRQQLNQEDKNRFLELKAIKTKLKEEMRAKGQKAHINQVSVLLYTNLKTWADLGQFEALSKHFNGEVPGTFPHRMVQLSAALSEPLSRLRDLKMQDKTAVRAALMAIAKNNEGQIYIENLQLDQFILECADGADDLIPRLFMSLKMLREEFEAMYKTLKIPEFDIGQVREMVEQAIREFKKSVPGCDAAFNKLLQSLDLFTDNFDGFYEDFNATGKHPETLLVGFIDQVSDQYKDIDNKECRALLRQFSAIKGEFAKRLGNKLDNPVIKALYDQLCSQLSTAESMVGPEEGEERKNEEPPQSR